MVKRGVNKFRNATDARPKKKKKTGGNPKKKERMGKDCATNRAVYTANGLPRQHSGIKGGGHRETPGNVIPKLCKNKGLGGRPGEGKMVGKLKRNLRCCPTIKKHTLTIQKKLGTPPGFSPKQKNAQQTNVFGVGGGVGTKAKPGFDTGKKPSGADKLRGSTIQKGVGGGGGGNVSNGLLKKRRGGGWKK